MIKRSVIFAALIGLSGLAWADEAPQNEQASVATGAPADKVGQVAQQKVDRQTDRVGNTVNSKVDEKTDGVVDKAVDKVFGKLFGH